jgi:hypothetical protein
MECALEQDDRAVGPYGWPQLPPDLTPGTLLGQLPLGNGVGMSDASCPWANRYQYR